MTCNFSLYIIILAMCFLKFMKVRYMKTASLGLLELEVIVVVRVNARGDAPPDPPSVGDQIWWALNSRNLYSRHV